ncbi:MAG: hypothetical protein RBU23_08215 [Candidatus Auribacterota bacterium]|jgi:hypothetical protein|nr:hypothetical protein [Candidatus Auribacterota bacterium]
MPDFVLTKSDDFGTLDSIVKTIRQGRLVTSDWFEPYYGFFTAVCVLAYKITGNFYLSSYGILMVFALLNFILIYALLVRHTDTTAATLLTLFIAILPGYLSKSLDLVGVIPTITLALGALILYQLDKINWMYFLTAFLAFSNRQNMAILMFLPMYRLVSRWCRDRYIDRKIIAYTGIYLFAAYIFHHMMNETYARSNITEKIASHFNTITFIKLTFTGFLFVMLFKLPIEFFLKGRLIANLKENIRRPTIPIAMTTCLLFYLFFIDRFQLNLSSIVQMTTPIYYFGHYSLIFIALNTLFFVSIWLSDYTVFRIDGLNLLLIMFLIMPPIRGQIWHEDYLHIILVLSVLTSLTTICYERRIFFSTINISILTVLLLVNLFFACMIKIDIDKKEVAVISFETLLRQNKISVDELSFASFGFIGWKLFDYSIHDTTYPFSHLAQFLHYIKSQKIYLQTHLPWRNEYKVPLSEKDMVLLEGRHSIGGFLLPYRVVRLHEPIRWTDLFYELDKNNLPDSPFPLNNDEWKKFLAGERLLH